MSLTRPSGRMTQKLGTEQASTSGTAIDFTGIPPGTTMIVVMLDGVSVNSIGTLLLRLGTAGGIDIANYTYIEGYFQHNTTPFMSNTTSGTAWAGGISGNADNAFTGQMILTLEDATNNVWTVTSVIGATGTTPYITTLSGRKALSGVLDRLRITTGNPDTFDAGAINIAYF